jgi:membrane fusion protein (multidrug efflux system)
MLIMIGAVLALILIIAGIKVLSIMKMMASFKPPPPAVVTTAKATYQEWQPELRGVGTLRALRGADLALDIAGLVTAVNVKSGQEVKAGQLLLQLRDTEDVAQLRQLEATTALAQVTYARAQAQAAVQVISKADYDTAAADLKAKQAAVEQQKVLVSKKQLRAPFAGRAGIVTVNPGTYLNAGTVVVTLQELDPIYVDFHLPQRNLADVHVGQRLTLTLDAFPDKTFEGAVSAVSPKIDADTRNVQIEGKAVNHDRVLTPGMFVNVSVDAGAQKSYLTLPQTSVVFNPYGETVFIVQTKHEADQAQAQAATQEADRADPAPQKTSQKKKAGPPQPQIGDNDLVVRQVFVTTGPTRGDQVAILKGLKDGDVVVSSGQIKLKNNAPVRIDNRVLPSDNPNPNPQEK